MSEFTDLMEHLVEAFPDTPWYQKMKAKPPALQAPAPVSAPPIDFEAKAKEWTTPVPDDVDPLHVRLTSARFDPATGVLEVQCDEGDESSWGIQDFKIKGDKAIVTKVFFRDAGNTYGDDFPWKEGEEITTKELVDFYDNWIPFEYEPSVN